MLTKDLLLSYKTIKIIIVLICVQCIYFVVGAQSYLGYHSSTYAGVYGIVTSPADILNHRFRGDINLAGVSSYVGNNIFTFRYKAVNDENLTYPDSVKRMGKLNFNTDVFGPSVLIKLSDKHAIAVTTRARVMANVHGISSQLLNSITQGIDVNNNRLATGNVTANVHAWKEIALTYSRQIANTDYSVWKAGISLKYLGGIAALSVSSNNLAFTRDSIVDPTGKKDAFVNAQGNIALSYTKNIDSLSDNVNDYLSFKNPGVGIDIGVSYEYRDEMQVYQTAYSDRTANYIWKLGASITDIGFIRYNKQQANSFVVNFSGNTYTTDQLEPPSDSSDVYQLNNYYKNLFKARAESSAFTMQLPTTLHLTYDRFFNKALGVQALINVPLIFPRISYYAGNYNPVSVIITPRAEAPWGGFYLPVSYNSISGVKAGAAIRLGPLVIGSSSIINTRMLNKTKAVDAYFILRIPFFGYRAYRDKDEFEKHPKLTKKQRRELNCPGK